MDRLLSVNIPENDKNYDIQITNSPIEALYQELLKQTVGAKRLIIFSEKVYRLYKKEFNFDKKEIFVLKDGEHQKTLCNYQKIIEKELFALINNPALIKDYSIKGIELGKREHTKALIKERLNNCFNDLIND